MSRKSYRCLSTEELASLKTKRKDSASRSTRLALRELAKTYAYFQSLRAKDHVAPTFSLLLEGEENIGDL